MEHMIRAFEGEKIIGKECTCCGEWKPLSQFSRERKAGDGLKSQCKGCKSTSRKDYYHRNIERFKSYAETRKEMTASLPSDVTTADIREVLDKYDFRCCLTGEQLDRSALHLDHIVPHSTGHVGHVKYNIWPISGDLNMSKGRYNVFQWAKERTEERGDVDLQRFNSVMREIASQIGLTVWEYESFVTWCHEYPRTVEEVKADPRPSIELWREWMRKDIVCELFINPMKTKRYERRAV